MTDLAVNWENTPFREISEADSRFIALSRVVMIISLVYHHLFQLPGSEFYPRDSLNVATAHIADYLNAVIHWSSMTAVPLLSIISGYLFFHRRRSNVNYFHLLHRRISTVLLPSVAWTSAWFLVVLLYFLWAQPYGLADWIGFDFERWNARHYLNGALGLTTNPLAYQFWFIHDLILTFVLTPVIGFCAGRFPVLFSVLLIPGWILGFVLPPFFSNNVLFFFSLGAIMATNRIGLGHVYEQLQEQRWLIYSGFCLLLLGRIFHDVLPVLGSESYLCLLRLAGVMTAFILLYPLAQKETKVIGLLITLSALSFFIFAFHLPTLDLLKFLASRLSFSGTEMGVLASLLLLPPLCIVLSVAIAYGIRWLSPPLFLFINGGRGQN